MHLHACMLLGFRYGRAMRVVPQIEIASYITHFGHQVTWIIPSEESDEFQERLYQNIRLFVIPCRFKNGVMHPLSKALYAIRIVRFVLQNAKAENYSLIFVRDGTFNGLLALYLKRRHQIPLVFEMSNPIEQRALIHRTYSRFPHLRAVTGIIDRHLTMHILRNADLVLPTTKWMADDFSAKGIAREKMLPYPNGVDLERFSGGAGERIRAEHRLGGEAIFVYVGTMDRERDLTILIRSFALLKKQVATATLLMVGDGTERERLEECARDLGVDGGIVFTGRVRPEEIPDYIDAAQIGVSVIPPLDVYKLSSPIKMLEYMAMGRPVVANEEIPEQKEAVDASCGGVLVKYDPESIAAGMLALCEDPVRAGEMGERGREWIVKNRSYEAMARRLEERYLDLKKGSAAFPD